MSDTKSRIEAKRLALRLEYQAALKALKIIGPAVEAAEALAKAWSASGEGREAQGGFGHQDKGVTLYLTLAPGEEFGHAAEFVEMAEATLRGRFPATWKCEASKIHDGTWDEKTARRFFYFHMRPPGGDYRDMIDVTVWVNVPVVEGGACQVVYLGEEPAPSYASYTRKLFKSTCPGDPIPVAGFK